MPANADVNLLRGAKECGQDEGSQKECSAWRVAMDLTRGRIQQPHVMAILVLYDMKEDLLKYHAI